MQNFKRIVAATLLLAIALFAQGRVTTFPGRVGIQTGNPTVSLGFGGRVAHTAGIERNTVAATGGTALTVRSGGATSGSTNQSGGALVLAPGVSTGTGTSMVRLQGMTLGTTGTADNTVIDRVIVAPPKNLTDAAINLFEIACPDECMTGGFIHWTIIAKDATDHQAFSGITTFAAVHQYGTATTGYTQASTNLSTTDAKAVTGVSTLTVAWALSTDQSDKVIMRVTPTGSLTETTYRITYTVTNNGAHAITIL